MGLMQERLQKATEEANRIHLENYPKADGNTPVADPNAPAPTPTPGSPVPSATVEPPPQPPASVQPTPTPPTPTPPTPTPPVEPDWKHKFEVLEGKYRKEIGDANAIAARAMQEVAEMKIQFAKQQTPPPAETKPAVKPEDLAVVENFKREYPDMLKDGFETMVRMITLQALEEALKGYLPQLKKLEKVDDLERRFAVKEQGDFSSDLTSLVPDWMVVNDQPEFSEYLKSNTERFTGATYWDLIRAAYGRGDAKAVAEFFTAYKAQNGKGAPAPTVTPPAPSPTAVAPNLPPNLAPPKPSGGFPTVEGHVSGTPGLKKIYTADQVRAFYNDVVKGAYRGREADAKAFEAEINLASQEGRIQG
jgi:hypothetical protein